MINYKKDICLYKRLKGKVIHLKRLALKNVTKQQKLETKKVTQLSDHVFKALKSAEYSVE